MNQMSFSDDEARVGGRPAQIEHDEGCAARASVFAPSEIATKRSSEALASAAAAGTCVIAEAKSDVGAALKVSREFDSRPFFSEAHLKPTFMQAYSLLNAIIVGGDAALELALQQPPLNQRKRKISRDRLELIALTLTAKPLDGKQQKQCSSHACVLKIARKENVSKEAFPAWLDEPNNGVKNCRQRAAKRRSKQSDPNAPMCKPTITRHDRPWFKLSAGKGFETDVEGETTFPTAILPDVEKLIETLSCASDVGSILRSLAEAFEAEHRRAQAKMRNILREPPEYDIND